jgi:hypothetical protein
MKYGRNLLSFAIVSALLFVTVTPVAAQAVQPSPTSPSRLSGKIFSTEGKPVMGATVMAYHLSTEELYSSAPTGADGEYAIDNLPYGYFDLAIETDAGVFVGNQVVNLAPSSKAVVNFTTVEYGSGDPAARTFPGADTESAGVARVREKVTGRAFWTSAKGVAILTGGGAVALLVIAAGADDDDDPVEQDVSPSAP